MTDSLLLVVALLLAICGMVWFALALKPHWQQVFGRSSPSGVHLLRALGALALAASLLLCLRADHPSIAVLVWVMALAGAALTVAFTLSWRPHWLRPAVFWRRR